MLTCHISHEKIFSTALYVPGRSGAKFIGDRVRGESNTPSINSTSTTFNIQKAKKKWENVVPLDSNNNDPHAQILKLFPELFSGVGCLDTMYRIDLKSDAQPVKHAARRVPESIRPKVKEELDRLVKDGIIKRVECPTDWVNSIVCVSKPNGNIRLCLDPKDLNKYIKRPHYYSPTIDDVLPDLCGSKFFSTVLLMLVLVIGTFPLMTNPSC